MYVLLSVFAILCEYLPVLNNVHTFNFNCSSSSQFRNCDIWNFRRKVCFHTTILYLPMPKIYFEKNYMLIFHLANHDFCSLFMISDDDDSTEKIPKQQYEKNISRKNYNYCLKRREVILKPPQTLTPSLRS